MEEGKKTVQEYEDGQTILVALDSIETDERQPRKVKDEDSIRLLAESIRNDGLIQNIAVRPVEGGRFKIVAGERRFLAIQRLYAEDRERWGRISAVVRLVDDEKALDLALLENVQREDLLPIDRAEALKAYAERNGIESKTALADRVGLSRPSVSNLYRILELDDEIKKEARSNKFIYLSDLIETASRKRAESRLAFFEKVKETAERRRAESQSGDGEAGSQQGEKEDEDNQEDHSEEGQKKAFLSFVKRFHMRARE